VGYTTRVVDVRKLVKDLFGVISIVTRVIDDVPVSAKVREIHHVNNI
jgi:hypothetical protein